MPILTGATAVGSEFAGKPRTVAWERLWAFSGGPFAAEGWPKKNIHTDLKTANELGVYAVSASATQYLGYAVSLLLDLFGDAWLSTGSLAVKFVAVVTVDDVLQAKARVVEVQVEDAGRRRVQLDVWCENQKGAKVLVGSATGVLD